MGPILKEPTNLLLKLYNKKTLDLFFDNINVSEDDQLLMDRIFSDIDTNMVSKDELEEIIFICVMGNDPHDHIFIMNHPELCEMCGWCCKNCDPIIVLPQEVAQIQSTHNLELYKDDRIGDCFKIKLPCAYQLENNKCSIYKSRPNSCKLFPISVKNGSLCVQRDLNCGFIYNFLINKVYIFINKIYKKNKKNRK